MDLPYSCGAYFNMELTHQELYPELKLSYGDTVPKPLSSAVPSLAEVLRELRTGAAWDKSLLVEVLSSEDKLLKITTTEINKLMRKARVSGDQWRAIKTAKRKIRKKLNKRASDGRNKSKLLKCEIELTAAEMEREELREEIKGLERECELYLVGMDRLQREWHSI